MHARLPLLLAQLSAPGCAGGQGARTAVAPTGFQRADTTAYCVLTRENTDERYMIDNEAHVMMAHMGEAIVRAWPRRPSPPAAP